MKLKRLLDEAFDLNKIRKVVEFKIIELYGEIPEYVDMDKIVSKVKKKGLKKSKEIKNYVGSLVAKTWT